MKKAKVSYKYQGFALEVPLIERIRKEIERSDNYKTVTEFVREAIKEKLDRSEAKAKNYSVEDYRARIDQMRHIVEAGEKVLEEYDFLKDNIKDFDTAFEDKRKKKPKT
jgi:Arc/MetJ-type ribon-helix-helix transcriptional regulator